MSTAGAHVRQAIIRLLGQEDPEEERKQFLSDEEYHNIEEDVLAKLGRQMLFNIMAVVKIEMQLCMLI